MDNMQTQRTQILEQSLINFLLNKKDIESKMGAKYRLIRTMTLGLNNENKKKPVFTVQIGMLSAEFTIMDGLKVKGSCYGIERYIRDWAERESIRNEMLDILNRNSGGSNGANILPNVRNIVR